MAWSSSWASTILSARYKGTLKWGNQQIQKREECDSLGLGQNLVAKVTQTYRTELLHAHWIGSFGMKTNSVSAGLERQQPDSKASFNHMKQRITNKMSMLLIEKKVGSHQVLDVGGRNHYETTYGGLETLEGIKQAFLFQKHNLIYIEKTLKFSPSLYFPHTNSWTHIRKSELPASLQFHAIRFGNV